MAGTPLMFVGRRIPYIPLNTLKNIFPEIVSSGKSRWILRYPGDIIQVQVHSDADRPETPRNTFYRSSKSRAERETLEHFLCVT